MKKIITSALVASTLAMAGGDMAPVVEEEIVVESSEWEQRILLYGWLPGLSGTLNYDIPGTDQGVSADASDIVDALEMTLMLTYEARKDKWSFKADVIYLDLANADENVATIPIGPGNGQVVVGAEQSMTAWILGFDVGYNIIQTENLIFDLLAGVRYLSLDVGADLTIDGPLPPSLPGRSLDQSEELWDAVIGFKGAYNVNDKWFIPYHFDIGAGDSELTWQALAGVGYRYSWGDALLVYRHLSYDQGDNEFINDLEISGPAIAVNFHF